MVKLLKSFQSLQGACHRLCKLRPAVSVIHKHQPPSKTSINTSTVRRTSKGNRKAQTKALYLFGNRIVLAPSNRLLLVWGQCKEVPLVQQCQDR
eukprot:6474742-Amphidinium_carterae.1